LVFGSERLTRRFSDRLHHHVHILEMNGDSYRSRRPRRRNGDKLTGMAKIQNTNEGDPAAKSLNQY